MTDVTPSEPFLPADDEGPALDLPGDAAAEAATPDLGALVAVAERQLLGGPRTLTREQVAERAEMPLANLERLWRALGFASVADDDIVFTEADVGALENVRGLQSIASVDDELMVAMVRIIGQSFARLASWQSQLIVELIAHRPELLEGGSEGLAPVMDLLVPTVERIQSYVWRRQVAAVFARMASNSGFTSTDTRPSTVGFVDMAGFTSFTRAATEAQLREVLTAFETLTTEVVAACDGQVVKTIGDEILYVCDEPGNAAEIALSLLERAEADALLPKLRAGVAFGPVVGRLGDVYGQTVNIASRLTAVARTGTVLVDDGLAEALDDDERFRLKSLRTTSVRGYHHLHPWRLRRATH